ncbi:MAG: MBL fold metallo-hydrolase, partial [Pygmaiobacter sp.]
ATIKLFVPVEYGSVRMISPEFTLRFNDAGHILGSASAEVFATENGTKKKVVFSGDLGNLNQPILKDPQFVQQADVLLIESTYGNRIHPEANDAKQQLARTIRETFAKGGRVIIPCFAVGRTQELLYYLRELYAEGAFHGYEHCPVYLDSPLAAEATAIFTKYEQGYYDEAAMKVVNKGDSIINFKQLALSISSDDSKAINSYKGSCIIISASGMCDAGRIRHHLKYNLWDARNTVVLVGFQAEGTLGRRLLEGEKQVSILGDSVAVNARIENVDGLSAHADRNGLLRWLGGFTEKPEMVFVVHGELDSATAFAEYITQERGFAALVPSRGDTAELLAETITLVSTVPPEEPEEEPVLPKEKNVAIVNAPRYGLGNLIGALQELEQSGVRLPRKKLEALSKAVDELLRSAH